MLPTHVVVTYSKNENMGRHVYKFQAGNRLQLWLFKHRTKEPVIAVQPLPPYMRKAFTTRQTAIGGYTGKIEYALQKKGGKTVATSYVYFPIDKLDHEITRGLGIGYFLELLTTSHPQTLGATHFATSFNPSDARKSQARKVGLPIGEPVPAEIWEEKLRKGVETAKRKA